MDHKFRIIHVNIRGIRSNSANLNNYLEESHYPEVVTLNETKLNINQSFPIPNYECIARKERRGCQHGSLILVRKDLTDITTIAAFDRFHEEVIGVKLNGNSTRPTINVITYYNPPNTQVNPNILQACRQLHGKTIITGDFNCKNVSWGSSKTDSQGRDLLKCINDNGLFIINNGAKTRYDPHTGKEEVLDLCLTNNGFIDNFESWQVGPDIGSDHFPTETTFKLQYANNGKFENARNFKNVDWNKFHNLLVETEFNQIPPETANLLNDAVTLLTRTIFEAFDKACPVKKRRMGNRMPFTAEMLTLVKEKRRLRRQKAEANRSDNRSLVGELQREINRKNHELKKLQKIRKTEKIRGLCHNLNMEKDSAKFFRLFDEIRGKESNKNVYCDIKDDGNSATSDKEKACLFAKRLERLHQTKNDASFNDNWKQKIESYIRDKKDAFEIRTDCKYTGGEPGDENNLLKEIRVDEINEQLSKCKNKSAPGEDGLNYVILKKLPEHVLRQVQLLFNVSLRIGYFPSEWKKATIKMVPKPGKDNKEARNWRPISLISCMGKLFERIVTARLSSYLESKNLLSSTQSGFRHGRMTTEQIFRLTEDSASFMKKKGITAALFLDAEAAFDQAWHDAIRYKLHQLGLPQRFVRLLSSFLMERKLRVKVGNVYSEEVEMKAGTPQGSCLSPLLYIILVNDIPNCEPASLGQFADDIGLWTTAFTFNAAISRLQKAVNEVEGWCRRWRIRLNGAKSQLLLIHRLNTSPCEDLCIQLFNDIVRPSTSARYLGIKVDDKLRFKEHFREVEAKATSRLNLFKLLVKNGVDKKILIKLYKTYVRPLLEYGSISFLPENLSQLQRIQNDFIRLCLKLPSYIRTDLVHQAAGIEQLKDRLLSLNCHLLEKMLAQKDIQKTVEKSLSVIPLNNYQSPLDTLLKK